MDVPVKKRRRKGLPVLPRLLAQSRVNSAAQCWDWVGWTYRDGRGGISVNGHRVLAHRAMFGALVMPLPEGTDIHHRCRNGLCVNPTHLEAIDHHNHMKYHRRAFCKWGHPLNDETVYIRPNGQRECRHCRCERVKVIQHRHTTEQERKQH